MLAWRTSSSRASVLAIATPTSSANRAIRSSASSLRAVPSTLTAPSAPHSLPSTRIGAATEYCHGTGDPGPPVVRR